MPLPNPPRIKLAQTPTPLQFLPRVSENLGIDIWIKRDDMTGSLLSGNKVRKLEYTVAQAQAEGCDTLITCGGLQSNHCRATAAVGAQLGLKVVLLLRGPADDIDGNFLLDNLLGADITVLNASEDHRRLPELMQQKAEQLRKQGHQPFIIPVGASDGIGLWGYLNAAAELKQDLSREGLRPSHIVCATGSAGTQAGLTLGAHIHGLPCQVIGMAVCDDEAYFQQKVRADIQQWQQHSGVELDLNQLEILVDDKYIGPGYAKAGPEVFATIAWLAKTEGILLDPVYTGKAFHGLVQEIRSGRFRDSNAIVFVHTGGTFGVFPYRHKFTAEYTDQ
ncbi:MAG: aminocyclopropane-1-carboxylate deaminase/D-cysteine desulfhydrase family protein [Candidatus Pelagadaptatus aseana]|uniref:D-cysteine desulfhydrase family protein n=1 Tax=Candidatus Pelagadaptatus aseana TaxID=3120508 RepID=UPI0039B252EA